MAPFARAKTKKEEFAASAPRVPENCENAGALAGDSGASHELACLVEQASLTESALAAASLTETTTAAGPLTKAELVAAMNASPHVGTAQGKALSSWAWVASRLASKVHWVRRMPSDAKRGFHDTL
jgi:hypothetical protein